MLFRWISKTKWSWILVLILTLGLAPYNPPHIWEKLMWIIHGRNLLPVDYFDILLHGSPYLIAFTKIYTQLVPLKPNI